MAPVLHRTRAVLCAVVPILAWALPLPAQATLRSEAGGPSAPADVGAAPSRHWCWQPIAAALPPEVGDAAWPWIDADRFVLARLEAAGLTPSGDADARTWLRRVTFDLTGLPPTPEQLAEFEQDPSPAARARAVDRLLASPHFGEQWGRHWLDLVRYAESLGHEFDFSIPDAWRYRDYVVRALNGDVPFDRFAVEHIAGDLLPASERRMDTATGADESVQATAFWWLGEQTHSPVDARQHTADRVDNQLDVFSKAFLGVTVACARCHDHKFDAISQADYYALSGYLKSSRFSHQLLHRTPEAKLPELAFDNGLLARRTLDALRAQVPHARRVLTAALTGRDDPKANAAAVAKLREVIAGESLPRDPRHPLHAALLLEGEGTVGDRWRHGWGNRSVGPAGEPVAGSDGGAFSGWWHTGEAFAEVTGAAPWWDDRDRRPRVTLGRAHHSGARGTRLSGAFQSPEFEIGKRYLHVLAAGRHARINLIVEGFHVLRNPIYGTAKAWVDDPRPRWYTIDCDLWQEHMAHLEAADYQAHDLGDPYRPGGYGKDGWITVYDVVASTERTSPGLPIHPVDELLGDRRVRDAEGLADALGDALERTLAHASDGLAGWELVDVLWSAGALGDSGRPSLPEAVLGHRRQWQDVVASLPPQETVPGIADGSGMDEHLFLRGDCNQRGEPVPRRFLSVLGGEAEAGRQGSGRLELARRVVAGDNPLTARVAVNRIWHHLFGRGIASTVDNLGILGTAPTHPELLDFLAQRFVADGWSIKRTIRRLLLSRTYAMASAPRADAAERDPDNLLWHRMPVRRLSGEALRDAILATCGSLDPRVGGPGVSIHLTDFMTGRGRPNGGPLDGDGRRSIYVQVRRNFLSPWMLAFDTPQPFSAVGRRSRTNVPSQALALLNDPMVRQQADRWAERELAEEGTDEARLDRMVERALGREATSQEQRALLAFAASHGDPQRGWSEVAHVLFNLKEFSWIH